MYAPPSISQPFAPGKHGFRQNSLRLGAPSLLPLERASCQVGLMVSQPSRPSTVDLGSDRVVRGDVSRSTSSPAAFAQLIVAADSLPYSQSSRSHVLFGAASNPKPPDAQAEPPHLEPSVDEERHQGREEPDAPQPAGDEDDDTDIVGDVAIGHREDQQAQGQVQPLECPRNPVQALLSVLDAGSLQVSRQIESQRSAVSASEAAWLLDIGNRLSSLARGLLRTTRDSGLGPHSTTVDEEEEDGMDVDDQPDDGSQEMSSEPSSAAADAQPASVGAQVASPFVFPMPIMPAGSPLYFMAPFMAAAPYPYYSTALAAHGAALSAQQAAPSKDHSALPHHSIPTPQSDIPSESGPKEVGIDYLIGSAHQTSIDVAGTLGIRSAPPPLPVSTPEMHPPHFQLRPIHPAPPSTTDHDDPTTLATTPHTAPTTSATRVRGPARSGMRRWTQNEYETLERAMETFGRAWTMILHAHGKLGLVDKALARFNASDLHSKVDYEVRKMRKAGLSDEQIGVFATAKPGVRGQVANIRWEEIREYGKRLEAEKSAREGVAGNGKAGESDGSAGMEQAAALVMKSNGTDSEVDESIHVDSVIG